MNTKTALAQPHVATKILAAAMSAVITVGLFTSVTDLFQRDGTPFERVVIAEHACANHALVSERETCVHSYLAAQRVRIIASR